MAEEKDEIKKSANGQKTVSTFLISSLDGQKEEFPDIWMHKLKRNGERKNLCNGRKIGQKITHTYS